MLTKLPYHVLELLRHARERMEESGGHLDRSLGGRRWDCGKDITDDQSIEEWHTRLVVLLASKVEDSRIRSGVGTQSWWEKRIARLTYLVN